MASDHHGAAVELKDNTVIVVLGASGDLAKKKTYPALFGLDIRIVGYARTKMDHDEYIRRIKSYIKTPTKESEQQLEEFCSICTYVSGHVFTIVSQHLKRCCYPSRGVARVIVEKPFGKDLASSRELQKSLEPDWREEELFRIDHYLGKEMVEHSYSAFRQLLPGRYLEQASHRQRPRLHSRNLSAPRVVVVTSTSSASSAMSCRTICCRFLRCLPWSAPSLSPAEDIRDEKVRVLRAIPAIEPKNVIIGQYGRSLDGSKPAYKEDDTVPKDSRCPTFCALVAYIKNERWDGVPFIMKAGKALNEQKTEIRVQFKDVTSGIFKDIPRNELVMRIQPNESVYIKMNSKLPGLSMQTVVTELDLTYRRRFSDLKIPEAYESLILDCLKGDHSNFVRDDELDASWRIFTPLLHYLDDNKEIIPMEYPYGSRGPAVLDDFTASYGYKFSDAAGYQWPTTSAMGSGMKL
ncbi:glucose-6-phosphate 1-dehydrogenase [Neurospora tetraspora]|uniref:Glucose-6-phosphate 1-dehydrogenase n=1 Tax=Neurospora tetraspora TaxID=94610 RepID=A0AAE0J083_9PEZI|nr:glucose-6-phosphate 1-dehydrogenase [Neurospora tetraspora]